MRSSSIKLAALLAALFISSPLSAAGPGDLLYQFPTAPASHCRDDFGAFANPVFPDLPGASGLAYRQVRFNSGGAAGHHVALNALGFGFGYSRLISFQDDAGTITDIDTDFYTIGKGIFIGNTLGLGASWSYGSGGRFDGYRSWTLGFLLRPSPLFSFGFVSRDMNRPVLDGEKVPRTDIYSFSLRPWRHYLTLSADMAITSGKGFREAEFTYALELMCARDISLFGAVTDSRDLSFGLRIPLDVGNSSAGGAFTAEYAALAPRHGGSLSVFGAAISGPRYHRPLGHPGELLKITLSDEIQEVPSRRLIGSERPVLLNVLSAISKAAAAPEVRGIILIVDNPRLGFARIQELREELARFRAAGKKVYALLMSSGNGSYYLASCADRIYFNPGETFMLSGLSAQVYFFRELLDKIGIKFESVRKGRYKFFNEPFTSRFMSEEYRSSLVELLTNLNNQFTGDIAASRRLSTDNLHEMFRRAMVSADEAMALGFVDAVMYPGPSERDILERERCRIVPLEEYLARERVTAPWGPAPEIAVIHVEGSIVRGNTGSRGLFAPNATGDETYHSLLTEAFSNPLVKAAVIRVNSGGGSAVASDLMLHYLNDTKGKAKKPVVFSFGDIAASGGYYIACSGDKIFASPGTLTGSIGVISGRVSLHGLYGKLGIKKETVKMSEMADIFTEDRDMTEKERAVFQKNVDAIYARFTKIVAEGRKIEDAGIPSLAEGRVFTGDQAKGKKLVDTLGSVMRAVEHARALVGISGEYSLRHYPQIKVPLGAELFSLAGSEAVSLPESFKKAASRLGEMELLYNRKEAALYLFPYKIVIE